MPDERIETGGSPNDTCACPWRPQLLEVARKLLDKFSDCKAHWLALMLTANRDKVLFETLHAGMEGCVNHLVRMTSLKVPRSYGDEMGDRERAVRAKVSGVSRVSLLSLARAWGRPGASMHDDRFMLPRH